MIEKRKILFVDDEPQVGEGLRRALTEMTDQWDLLTVESAVEAFDILEETSIDVVVTDLKMPGMDGFDLLESIRRSDKGKEIPVIILTGVTDGNLKRRALDQGATDLLNKPIDREDLVARLRSALRLKAYQDEIRGRNEYLELQVAERTADLETSRLDIVWRLAKAGEFRDEETGNHVVRVACYCRAIAETLNLDRRFIDLLFLTSPLHDIGKIGISDTILLKKGKLSSEERAVMQEHCAIGSAILGEHPKGMELFIELSSRSSLRQYDTHTDSLLRMASSVAMTHHERWDGKGYPQMLSGHNIPLEGRIVAIADVFDALNSVRPYKPALPETEVLAIMREGKGTHFDPDIFEVFESSLDQLRDIRKLYSDLESVATV